MTGLTTPPMNNNLTSFCIGSPGAVIIAQVYYAMPVIGIPAMLTNASSYNGSSVIFISATSVFKNEPFTYVNCRAADMSLEIYHRVRSFVRQRQAASTVEFAFLVPVVLLLLLMGFDTGRYVLATQRIQEVANSVAEMLSQTDSRRQRRLQPPQAGAGYVQDSDLHFYYDSAMATYPDVLTVANNTGTYWWQLLTVQMTSIYFNATPTNCVSPNCTYTPEVVWTTGARSCGLTITAASDTSGYNASTLPTRCLRPRIAHRGRRVLHVYADLRSGLFAFDSHRAIGLHGATQCKRRRIPGDDHGASCTGLTFSPEMTIF